MFFWLFLSSALSLRATVEAGVLKERYDSCAAYCNSFTQIETATGCSGWQESTTTTTVTTVTTSTTTTTVPGTTITTTTCGNAPVTSVTTVATVATVAAGASKRGAASKPSCHAVYPSGPALSSACSCTGGSVPTTITWYPQSCNAYGASQTSAPVVTDTTTTTQTTTTTATVTGNVIIQYPIVDFQLLAEGVSGSSIPADSQYALIEGGNVYFNLTQADASTFTLTGTTLVSEDVDTLLYQAAQPGNGQAIEFVPVSSATGAGGLPVTLDCDLVPVGSDCTLACTANGDSDNYLYNDQPQEYEWYLGNATLAEETGEPYATFTVSVVPVALPTVK